MGLPQNEGMRTSTFPFNSPDTVIDWSPIDDRVMGGCSTSRFRYDPLGYAVFEGTVKAENNGGFASVRTRAMALMVDGASAFVLKVNTDGKRYKFSLRMNDNFDGVAYQASFVAPAGIWTTLDLPVSQFAPTFRGRLPSNAPALTPALVRQFGFTIADRQWGDFSLKVSSIGTK